MHKKVKKKSYFRIDFSFSTLKITRMRKKYLLISSFLVACALGSNAQDIKPDETLKKNWQHLDYKSDEVPGVSANEAYEKLLKGKKSQKVIVAVIDSGIDTEHEDLKDILWVNKDEIPNNNIDDDKNGFIDDVHGWNFLGGTSGENITDETLEYTRLYKRYNGKKNLTAAEKKNYKLAKKLLTSKLTFAKKRIAKYQDLSVRVAGYDQYIKNLLKTDKFEKEDLEKIAKSKDRKSRKIANFLLDHRTVKRYESAIKWYEGQLAVQLNTEFNARAEKVGDNTDDIKDTNYGNNIINVEGNEHGTHVSGIIAAKRNNNIGINGVADNVEIMTVRAVPNGDERDKDIALAVRYAVDNGAQVINMSFGKLNSLHPEFIEEAFRYAEEKNVLIVAAAGNDSQNLEDVAFYPRRSSDFNNWLHIGASSRHNNKELTASFSNYSTKYVDVFSPGVKIYSTMPDSKYAYMSGTSMASPVAAGCAAVLRSYFPELSAKQVKEILMKSAQSFEETEIYRPNPKRKKKKVVKFSELSQTGGVVNLYDAILLAEKELNK